MVKNSFLKKLLEPKCNLINEQQFIFFERKQLQALDNAGMKCASSLLSQIKCWTAIAKLNWYGGLIKRVKTVENILRFTSLFHVYKDIYRDLLPRGQLNSVCNHEHEVDHNLEWAQRKLIP